MNQHTSYNFFIYKTLNDFLQNNHVTIISCYTKKKDTDILEKIYYSPKYTRFNLSKYASFNLK